HLAKHAENGIAQSEWLSTPPSNCSHAPVSDFQAGQRLEADLLAVNPGVGMVRAACEPSQELIDPHRPQEFQKERQTNGLRVDDLDHIKRLGIVTQQESATGTRPPGMTLPAHRELPVAQLHRAQV